MKRLFVTVLDRIRYWRRLLPVVAVALAGGYLAAPDTAAQQYSQRERYCQQLEQKLASDWVQGQQRQDRLPELRRRIRKQEALHLRLQRRADRADCYETLFLFGKSLRRTRKCLRMDRKIKQAEKNLSRLEAQRSRLRRPDAAQSRRQQIIRELARYGCGQRYQRQARRQRSNNIFSWFTDDDPFFGRPSYEQPRYREEDPLTIQPYATYRTMCVRLCDGYYFPVSFSTLPQHFEKDVAICQNKCAAPAQLHVYRNPGGDIQQMTSINGAPYAELPNAWLYQKKYIKGCSCKPEEFLVNNEAAGQADPADAPPDPQPQSTPPALPRKQSSTTGADKKPASVTR